MKEDRDAANDGRTIMIIDRGLVRIPNKDNEVKALSIVTVSWFLFAINANVMKVRMGLMIGMRVAISRQLNRRTGAAGTYSL